MCTTKDVMEKTHRLEGAPVPPGVHSGPVWPTCKMHTLCKYHKRPLHHKGPLYPKGTLSKVNSSLNHNFYDNRTTPGERNPTRQTSKVVSKQRGTFISDDGTRCVCVRERASECVRARERARVCVRERANERECGGESERQ